MIKNDDEHQVSQFGTVNDLTVSKVKIVSVEKHNYGDYQCKATNKLGSARARLNLYSEYSLVDLFQFLFVLFLKIIGGYIVYYLLNF